MFWPTVVVLGRILAESGSPPPDVHDPAVLLVKRQNVTVGCTPPPGDAGVPGDATIDAVFDSGIADAGVDAGPADAGLTDAGAGDAGMPDAGTCTTILGDAVTMIVQPHVSAGTDGTRFAVLLVTPERPIVELAGGNVLRDLARISAPRIEYKTVEVPDRSMGEVCASGCGEPRESESGGCGGDWGSGESWNPPGIGDAGLGDGGLVEEMLGPYQFVRAQPADAAELATWFDQLGYAYMQGDLDAVAPYIALDWHVVAIRVALDEPENASLSPIALTWPGSQLRIPAALGQGAAAPGQLTVYIAGDGQYVLPGANIRFAKRVGYSGASYLTRNEIKLDQNQLPLQDPIAYRGNDVDVEEVTVVTKEVRVPVEVPCEDEGGCCSDCNAKPRARVDLAMIVVAVAFVLRRRRRR
jgi:hypothetical protein